MHTSYLQLQLTLMVQFYEIWFGEESTIFFPVDYYENNIVPVNDRL